jgi:oligopeptide/dipeptide ABC transporter ATP-binding protein
MNVGEPLLQIEDLVVDFVTYEGTARVLNGLNLALYQGDVLGLVGESGCGKTVTSMAITRLISSPPAKIVAGKAFFRGRDLLTLSKNEIRKVRSKEIAMVFQDPSSNLNPLLPIGQQVTDTILCRMGRGSTLHLSPLGSIIPSARKDRKMARERGILLLEKVGIQNASGLLSLYPFQFSGGMKQRTLIAMALGGEPELLIADEPTTDLDVSIQAQVLRLIRKLVRELGLSVLWITHDLGVVSELCNRVAVMYAGNIVEIGEVDSVLNLPKHPYTVGLMQATPRSSREQGKLHTIPGTIPSLYHAPSGCRFHTRCEKAMTVCKEGAVPNIVEISPGHQVACYLYSGAPLSNQEAG